MSPQRPDRIAAQAERWLEVAPLLPELARRGTSDRRVIAEMLDGGSAALSAGAL